MAKRGRPTKYTDDLADEICRRLCEGESLRSICEDDDKPSAGTVIGWVVEDREGFSERYVRAREVQAHRWADEITEISDKENADDTQRAKLRVDTRKWLLSKLLPEKYGKRQRLEHTGKGGGPMEVEVEDARERLRSRISGIASRIGAGGGAPRTNGDGG